MSNCNQNCAACSKNCQDRKQESLLAETSDRNHIRKIIAVISGKGGVGKSTVTSLLAVQLAKKGYRVGILDADITGPSIPKAFGVTKQVVGDGSLMFAPTTSLGIKVMSVNLLIEDPTKPVLWRGPIIGGAVKQFYTDVLWEELDFLLIDMPPGTGDVALTVFQSIPVDEAVLVTTPQDLVSMIVGKAVHMCEMMNISMIGMIENMSYIQCPCCMEKIHPYGPSKLEEVAKEYHLNALDCLPIDSQTAELMDEGLIESSLEELPLTVDALEKLL